LALQKQNLTKLAAKWALGEEVKQKIDVLEEFQEECNKKFEISRNFFFYQNKVNREQWDNTPFSL